MYLDERHRAQAWTLGVSPIVQGVGNPWLEEEEEQAWVGEECLEGLLLMG